jgi:hypothetical protein
MAPEEGCRYMCLNPERKTWGFGNRLRSKKIEEKIRRNKRHQQWNFAP